MSNNKTDGQRYDVLYEQLLLKAMDSHEHNKKRLRAGLIVLAAAPAVLCLIRALTDSDKVVFLIIWIVLMFAICSYLIGVEYLDDSLKKTLEEVTRREVSFDDLYMGPEQLQEMLHERAAERQEMLHERIEESQEHLQERIAARQDRLAAMRERRREMITELLKRRDADTDDAADAADASKAAADAGAADNVAQDAPERGDES
ncbi:MAG: hypothetical protein IJH95_02050 [Mogibacterium sp.]|nr:hypothetical protein [Mogibacterium sp.]